MPTFQIDAFHRTTSYQTAIWPLPLLQDEFLPSSPSNFHDMVNCTRNSRKHISLPISLISILFPGVHASIRTPTIPEAALPHLRQFCESFSTFDMTETFSSKCPFSLPCWSMSPISRNMEPQVLHSSIATAEQGSELIFLIMSIRSLTSADFFGA